MNCFGMLVSCVMCTIAYRLQLDVTRPLRYLVLIASTCPMPRAVYTQASAERAIFASHNTSGRAVEQSLRSSGAAASIRRWEVPTGCAGSTGSARATEISLAVWMGCRQTRRHASWPWHTNTINGTVTELRRDIGAGTVTMSVEELRRPNGKMIPQSVDRFHSTYITYKRRWTVKSEF
jgi:hypothetical protein